MVLIPARTADGSWKMRDFITALHLFWISEEVFFVLDEETRFFGVELPAFSNQKTGFYKDYK